MQTLGAQFQIISIKILSWFDIDYKHGILVGLIYDSGCYPLMINSLGCYF